MNYKEWTTRLFEYFFADAEQSGESVTQLTVVSEVLSEISGLVSDHAASDFAHAVKHDARRENLRYFAAAEAHWQAQTFGPDQPFWASFGYLAFVMHALTESEADGETATRQRIRNAVSPCSIEENDWPVLARLWHSLSAHLASPTCGYRRLLLPAPPPHWANLVESVGLAFPHRRDLAALSELLSDERLLVENPPVLDIIWTVQRNRQVFRPRFMEAFEEFRQEHGKANTPTLRRRLAGHRFWRAVRLAARHAVQREGAEERGIRGSRLTLVSGWDKYGMPTGPWLASDRRVPSLMATFKQGLADAPSKGALLEGIDQGRVPVDPFLRRRVVDGLLPFAEGDDGTPELVASVESAEWIVCKGPADQRVAGDVPVRFRTRKNIPRKWVGMARRTSA